MDRKIHLYYLLLGLLLPACGKSDSIETYRLAKESPQPQAPASSSNTMTPLPGMAPAASAKEIEWKVPKGWKEQAPSSMRVGSFLIIGGNGQQADVSVIPLSGMAGGDLANINRWRDQIELPPLTEANLARQTQTLKIKGQSVSLVNFVSEKLLIEGKYRKRVIAATLPQGERTWFFKMTGEDETVQKSKQKFIEFLTSVSLK